MAQEIEMNFKVKDKKGLLSFLRNEAKEKISKIEMTYFGSKNNNNFYIRIEEIEDNSGKKRFLTAKGNFKSKDGINQRKEVTLPITENPQEYVKFLQLIGMELRDTKKKIRHQFKIDDLDITLDEWNVEELGDRLEIEGKLEEAVKRFSKKIIQFCDPAPSK